MFLIPICAAIGLAIAYFGRKQLKEFILTARYEAIYWLLGIVAVGDDLIYSRRDKLKGLPTRTGEVAVVTGGSRGIGYYVVKRLLECDMHVVIGCRNVEAGNAAIEKIRLNGTKSGSADVMPLDTASMRSVRKFAAGVLSKVSKVNLLVNNAGIMFVPYSLTEDGFESQLTVNYIGHFLLTHLLLPLMKETGQNTGRASRVVNVSSCGHLPGSIHFTDMHFKNSLYIPSEAYAQSKLAQLMFTKAVDRRMKSEDSRVLSFAVHPGVVDTDLFNGTLLKRLMPWAPRLFFKSAEQGSTSIVHCCISDALEKRGGAYIANCREMWTSSAAGDTVQQDQLVALTEKMLAIRKFGEH